MAARTVLGVRLARVDHKSTPNTAQPSLVAGARWSIAIAKFMATDTGLAN